MFLGSVDLSAGTLAAPRKATSDVTMVDLFDAADKSYQTLDSVAARSLASDEAIEERNRLIKQATGVSLANPHRVVPLVPEDEGMPVTVDPWAEYRKGLADVAKRFPEHRKIIQPDLDPRAAANLYGRKAEQDLMRLRAQYGDDWWSSIKANAAMFAGAMYGMRTDPANLAASMVGFNAARTGFYGLLAASAKNAAANAGIQLAQEPLVQMQRGEAGAASGWEHSAFNVAAAAVFGGALDLGVRATARGVRAARGQVANTDTKGYITGWRHHTEDEPPKPIKVKAATLQKAMDGDLDSLKTVTRELEIDQEPEIRALTEAAEIDAELAAKMRENGLDDGTNLRNLAQAIRAATDDAEPPPVQAEDRMVFALARRERDKEAYGIDDENAFNDAIFSQGLNPDKPVRYRGRERYVVTEQGDGHNSHRSHRLIKKGNQVVARATIYEVDGNVQIGRIDTVPKMRRRGIGRTLVEGILNEFEGQQVRTSARTKLGTELFKRYDDGDGNLVLPGSLAAGDGAPSRFRRLVDQFVPAWMGRDRFIATLEAENPRTPAEARRLVGHELQRDTHEMTQNTLLGARTRFIDDPERVKRIDDAGGPEAKAQIEDLESNIELPVDDISDDALYALRAMHASPFIFDKFDISKLGTGEGAYLPELIGEGGRGHYFTTSEDRVMKYHEDITDGRGEGAIYDVRIEADEDQLLDLDVEIFDQPPHIQAMLEAMGIKSDADMLSLPRHEDGQAAMKKAGLVGVAYTEFDGNLQGHQNYVIYDDDAIVITHRDGEPVGDDQRSYLLAERQNAFNHANAVRALVRDGVGSLGAHDQIAPTDLMRAVEPELRREIMDIAERMPEGYGFALAMRLRSPEGLELDGVTDHLARTVKVALAAQDPARVARHEEIHVLRELGLIRDDEWETLVRHARKNNLREKYQIDGRYGEIYGKKFANDPNRVEQMLIEETIAEMWGDRIAGTSFGETIDRMIDNVVALLNEIAKALGMKGVQRINQVYRRIESGEIGRRRLSKVAVSRETGQAYAIAGENALTANKDALAAAKKLEREGASREDIWDTTGWWRGPDSNWRFEVDDSRAAWQLKDPAKMFRGENIKTVTSEAVDHAEIFKAYPWLRDVALQYVRAVKRGPGAVRGVFVPPKDGKPSGIAVAPDEQAQVDDVLSVLLHEMQHAIQEHEGFAKGGNRKMFTDEAVAAERNRILDIVDPDRWVISNEAGDMSDDVLRGRLYRRLAGETEARLVQRRANMTPDERADRAPWLDFDTEPEMQIVKFDDMVGQSARSENVASVVEVCKL